MGSKQVGKVLGVKQQSTTDTSVQEPQYIKLENGSFSLYEPSQINLTYSQTPTNTGAKGQARDTANPLGKNPANKTIESATYNGQNVELNAGNIRMYSQADYDNWQTQQQQQQQSLNTAIKANTQNLSTQRNRTSTSSTSNRTSIFTPSGSGVFSGITE